MLSAYISLYANNYKDNNQLKDQYNRKISTQSIPVTIAKQQHTTIGGNLSHQKES